MHDTAFAQASALLLGVPEAQLPGHQLLVDRNGWLRARSTPQSPGWREDDLICKPAEQTQQEQAQAQQSQAQQSQQLDGPRPAAQGLDGLIARMDAAPLSPLRAGFLHR